MKRRIRPFTMLAALLSLLLLLLPAAPAQGDECSHEWVLISAVPATCTESGVEVYRCSLCGAEKQVPVAALGHIWSYCVTLKKATCTEEGLIRCYCARDESHYEDKVEPAKGHSWGDWCITKPATLNEWGVLERQCSRCKETETRRIQPLAYREPYGLTLILSPLPPEVRFEEDQSLTLTQELSLVNTGENDLYIREYICREGMTKALDQPLHLLRGQAVTFPLTCVFTAEELSLLTADRDRALPLTLCFYGSLGSAARVCASNRAAWEWALPGESSDVSDSPLRVTQTLLSSSADPAGYQLHETLRCRVSVTNEGDEPLPEIRLQAASQTEPLIVEDLAPGETRNLFWSHSVTLEEAIAGYSLTTWQAFYPGQADGAAPFASSNAIVVPVTSQLDMLLDAAPLNAPKNGLFYERGEEVCFRFRLQNNGALTLSNVTVFDPFHPDDPSLALGHLELIQPEESLVLEVRCSITDGDAQSGVLRFAAAAQGYDAQGTLHTWHSGEITVLTAMPTD